MDGIGYIAVGDPASDSCPCGCGSTRLEHVNQLSDFDLDTKQLEAAWYAEVDANPPTEEEMRRMAALCQYKCPDHGCDLEETTDYDENGAHVTYYCQEGGETFPSHLDPVGGYCPVDNR